jgi:hypothetical protein
MKNKQLPPVSTEFQNTDFGDVRLTRRLQQIAESSERNPSASLPEQSGSSAALEATYRFIENDSVSAKTILDSHIEQTSERAGAFPYVYVIHDTTDFKFKGEQRREGLGWVETPKDQGFFGHFSICASPSGEPLGTLGLYAWSRQGRPKGHRRQNVSQSDPDRESLRWIDAGLSAAERLYGKTEAIHLMDREGDSYELFSFLLEHEQRFVIRLSHDRRLEQGRAAAKEQKLFESLSNSPYFFDREVVLSERNTKKSPRNIKVFPPRARRLAHLEVRAATKEIFIGNGAPAHLPPSLKLNFIEVRETETNGTEEPVLWRLVSTEPIETEQQVAAIVDAYRQRWLIEEFFKALKTGCRYQDHQLDSASTLLVMLTIESAVAWKLLLCRWIAHNEPDAPAERIISPIQLKLLKLNAKQQKRKVPEKVTASFVLQEIALLGGHIKNNGAPGWLVLRRGFDQLFLLERGWRLAQDALDK